MKIRFRVRSSLPGRDYGITDERMAEAGIRCPDCERAMTVRRPRFGDNWTPFASCAAYPACKGTRRLDDVGWLIVGESPPPDYEPRDFGLDW